MQPLRIGHFQSGYPIPDGVTAAVTGFARGLARAGHQVFIYGCGPNEALTAETRADGQNLTVALYPSASRNPFHVRRALLQRIRRNQDQLDLLVIHGMFNPPDAAVARAASGGQLPYIVCPHGPYHPALLAKHRIRKAVYGALFERRKLTRARAVQVFSDGQADLCREYGIRTPAIVVPNGFDARTIPASESRTPALVDGNPKLLYLGRIDRYHKGLDLLLCGLALALGAPTIPATTVLTIVGPESEDSPALRALVEELNLGRNVRFFGRAVDPVRWHLLESCDLFVLPSRYDGFAMAALEALTVGKPLLLSDQAAVTPWLAPSGCAFVARPDAEAISVCLARAVRLRDQWEQMGLRGLEYARGHLTWDHAARTATLAYSRLLGQDSLKDEQENIAAMRYGA
jgi:glycosyltransferase involved in cell wall biosynthesis